jgi:hypothetical protein
MARELRYPGPETGGLSSRARAPAYLGAGEKIVSKLKAEAGLTIAKGRSG